MTLEELYKTKGKLTTELEIIQSQLQQVNQMLIEELKKQQKPTEPVEVEEAK